MILADYKNHKSVLVGKNIEYGLIGINFVLGKICLPLIRVFHTNLEDALLLKSLAYLNNLGQ